MSLVQYTGLATRPSLPRLPIELWTVILEYAIEVPVIFDATCEPAYFYLFVADKLGDWNEYTWNRSERDRRSFSLVCKQWNTILLRSGRRYIWEQPWDLTPGVKRVDFSGMSLSTLNDATVAAWSMPEYTNSLTTIGLESPWKDDVDETFKAFFQMAKNARSLRSFIYRGNSYDHLHPSIVHDLGVHFPFLTSLFIIGCREVQGNLALQHLKTLYLDVPVIQDMKWWFPSLRHLGLGGQVIRWNTYSTSLIPGPPERLQSLMLPSGHSHLWANEEFWNDHPSLQLLGVSSKSFTVLNSPPINHPFSFLYFTECKSSTKSLEIGQVAETLSQLPGLVTVNMPGWEWTGEDIYAPEWLELYRSRKKTGLTWMDKDGSHISFWTTKAPEIPVGLLLLLVTIDLSALLLMTSRTSLPHYGPCTSLLFAIGSWFHVCYYILDTARRFRTYGDL